MDMHGLLKRTGLLIGDVVSSRRFTWFLLAAFIVQALWIAFSFRYPMIYDEGTHVAFIQQYSHTFSPYTTNVPPVMTTQVSFFHYLLSYPYRLLDAFGVDIEHIVITLRVINIGMVAVGLGAYIAALSRVGLKRAHINLGIVLFSVLPVTSLVAATINYDNMLFLLTAVYLWLLVGNLTKPAFSLSHFLFLISVGLFTTLVKYVFIPFFAITIIALIVYRLKWFSLHSILGSVRRDWVQNKLKVSMLLLMACVSVLSVGFVYGGNLIKYHSIRPNCVDIRAENICLSNAIVKRDIEAKDTASSRDVDVLDRYLYVTWTDQMVQNTLWTGNSTSGGKVAKSNPLPVMRILLFFGALLGLGAVLLQWHKIKRFKLWTPIVLTAVLWVLIIMTMNISTYYELHQPFAIQPRYLILVLPIILVLVVQAMSLALRSHYWAKVSLLFVVMLMATQGGGVLTHIVRSEPDWYWSGSHISDLNTSLKTLIRPAILEDIN